MPCFNFSFDIATLFLKHRALLTAADTSIRGRLAPSDLNWCVYPKLSKDHRAAYLAGASEAQDDILNNRNNQADLYALAKYLLWKKGYTNEYLLYTRGIMPRFVTNRLLSLKGGGSLLPTKEFFNSNIDHDLSLLTWIEPNVYNFRYNEMFSPITSSHMAHDKAIINISICRKCPRFTSYQNETGSLLYIFHRADIMFKALLNLD